MRLYIGDAGEEGECVLRGVVIGWTWGPCSVNIWIYARAYLIMLDLLFLCHPYTWPVLRPPSAPALHARPPRPVSPRASPGFLLLVSNILAMIFIIMAMGKVILQVVQLPATLLKQLFAAMASVGLKVGGGGKAGAKPAKGGKPDKGGKPKKA